MKKLFQEAVGQISPINMEWAGVKAHLWSNLGWGSLIVSSLAIGMLLVDGGSVSGFLMDQASALYANYAEPINTISNAISGPELTV